MPREFVIQNSDNKFNIYTYNFNAINNTSNNFYIDYLFNSNESLYASGFNGSDNAFFLIKNDNLQTVISGGILNNSTIEYPFAGSGKLYFQDYLYNGRFRIWDGSSYSFTPAISINIGDYGYTSASSGLYIGDYSSSYQHIKFWKQPNLSWTSFTSEITSSNVYIYNILSSSEGIYAGCAALNPNKCIYFWNGINWSSLGFQSLGTTETYNQSFCSSIFSGSDGIYIGGTFEGASGNYISKWNGNSWDTLSGGLNGTVNTIFSHSSGVYVGGYFSGYISKWDGKNWYPVDIDFNGVPDKIIFNNNDLILLNNEQTVYKYVKININQTAPIVLNTPGPLSMAKNTPYKITVEK